MNDKLKDIINSNDIHDSCKSMPYGTAGYRMNSKYLNGFTVRMSLLAAMRSMYKAKTVGIMITASHNPEHDNGIKLVDPDGEMLTREWEFIAMEFVEWISNDFCNKFINKCSGLKIDLNSKYKGSVLIGFDTRNSSPLLAEIATSVLKEFGCEYFLFEYITTPQLHFFVKYYNENPNTIYNNLIEHYFDKLSNAFCMYKSTPEVPPVLNVDCANGVGATHLERLSKLITNQLNLKLHNISKENLNFDCGADYVKIKQSVPVIHNGDCSELVPGSRWCSIDGDADRIVYFSISHLNKMQLFDGDKIAVLMADYLTDILKTELELNHFSMAIIQTAYANSASTEYIENRLKIKTECVPTGVKYLHKAAKGYDIGIYFEANGHGTVLFSEKLRDYAATLSQNHELCRFINIINEADGDAISDLLIIEHILSVRNWNLDLWYMLYTDYPSRQLKVTVPDRNVFITTDAERKLESPIILQNAIDKAIENQLIMGFKHSRAFVRPSGTEDIVRIYVESSNQEGTDQLAHSLEKFINEMSKQ